MFLGGFCGCLSDGTDKKPVPLHCNPLLAHTAIRRRKMIHYIIFDVGTLTCRLSFCAPAIKSIINRLIDLDRYFTCQGKCFQSQTSVATQVYTVCLVQHTYSPTRQNSLSAYWSRPRCGCSHWHSSQPKIVQLGHARSGPHAKFLSRILYLETGNDIAAI